MKRKCKLKGCKSLVITKGNDYCSRRCAALSRPWTYFKKGHKYHKQYSAGGIYSRKRYRVELTCVACEFPFSGSPTARFCPRCARTVRKTGQPEMWAVKAVKEHSKIVKKSPPREELNKAWMELRSYKKIAKRYRVSEKTLEVWMGLEKYMISPGRCINRLANNE